MLMAPPTTHDPPKDNDGTGFLEDALLPPNDRRKVELDKSPASGTLSVIPYNIVWRFQIRRVEGERAGYEVDDIDRVIFV